MKFKEGLTMKKDIVTEAASTAIDTAIDTAIQVLTSW